MNGRPQEQCPPSSDEAPRADVFVRAAADLGARRPIRNKRLRQIALELRNGEAGGEERLSAYLAKVPGDADALCLLADAASADGRRREAASLLARCLEIAPDFALARFNYANLLSQLGRYDAALNELNRLLEGDSRNPIFRQMKANILETIGETERSLAIAKDLAAENPGSAASWIGYGRGLRAAGHRDESIAAYRKAIERQPSCGTAYWSLANLKTFRFSEAEMQAMREQLKRTEISPADRAMLRFSLGKAYEDLGDYRHSFEQYARANAALRLRVNYDPDTLTADVAANKALFTPEFLASRRGGGCPAPDAIFILGRPRSGSTLIEQILSSHSAIEGTSELPYVTGLAERLGNREWGPAFGSGYLKALAAMEPAALRALGEEYMESARIHRRLGRPFFTDKKPTNFSHVGMIHLMLPNAKIIDARRHPAACSFSSFKMYSSKSRLRLSELGRFYWDYAALMAHFDSVLPGRIHRVVYENMVRDPEHEVHKLLDYLGLPFEETCLRFYETKRTVLTPSSEQVRRPISSDAVDHWRKFEPWLGPLIESLGTVFTDYPDVPDELRRAG